MAFPAAEPQPQDPSSHRPRTGKMTNARDDVTILLLLVLAIFIPPVAVLCVTSCDAQFGLNVALELLTFGIASFFHAIWVVLYYGKYGRLTWGQRRELERKRRAKPLELTTVPQPAQVRSEAYADAPAYSAHGGGHGGDSKFV